MISDTPASCILLLEDLDCAFPHSREDDPDDEAERDPYSGQIMSGHAPAKSKVTLSGLLNVLDSISSEEGRVTFATVCHVLLTRNREPPY
jgi:chaperone BCS1